MNIFEKYISHDLSVIPCEMKRPLIPWQQFQTRIPTPMEARGYASQQIAIVCGWISGGVVCVDFDTKNGDQFVFWANIMMESYDGLYQRLVVESTPSGGFHVIFRTSLEVRNVKLAKNLEQKATIETRGEGGYFVCAPSPGYVAIQNDFDRIPLITEEEAETILSIARSLNECPEDNPQKESESPRNFNGLSPFDDYNARHNLPELLQQHGWRLLFERGEALYFSRPDKQGGMISATWNKIPGRFYVFTTSTVFENNHVYKPSAVYAILECGGDYKAAAKALYSAGFGKLDKPKARTDNVGKYEVRLLDPALMKLKLHDIVENGYPKGRTTGWSSLDALYSVIKGQCTVVTGMPSHGKSEFMDALAINLMAQAQWKFAIFSPENYPMEMHCHKLIEKITGRELRSLPKTDIDFAMDIIAEHFFFIDAIEEDIDLEAILGQTEVLIREKGIDGLIIDPWNEIELSKPRDVSDSDFVGVCLRKIRKFARKHKIHLWIVAHPTKMTKDKSGKYPIPELYDIMGSSHWRNKADNGICVHRNFDNDTTEIHIQKIKFRYAGKQGICIFKYDEACGRYKDVDYEREVSTYGF